jgi:hypothetical protein
MSTHADEERARKDVLLHELTDKIIRLGWLVPESAGVRGIRNFFSNASEDTLKDLIAASERRIANPPRCR